MAQNIRHLKLERPTHTAFCSILYKKRELEQQKNASIFFKEDQFLINGIRRINEVFVRNIPPEWTEERLKSEFSKYGQVEHVSFLEPQSIKKKAFVTFKHSKDAAKVLTATFREISECDHYCPRMFVIPAYVFHQNSSQTTSCSQHMSVHTGQDPLTELDLLNNIPRNLPENISLSFLKGIFQHSGVHLKKINLQKVNIFCADGLIEAIANTCSQLEDLRLEGLYINDVKADKLKTFKNLKVLSMKECNPMKDAHLEVILCDNKVLTHLEVISCVFVRGTFLRMVNSPLQTLDLSENKLDSSTVPKYLKRFSSTLENFTISQCKSLHSGPDSFIKYLPSLKSLNVSGYVYFGEYSDFKMWKIANLKLLEYLDVSENDNITESLMETIIKKCPKLELLNISGSGIEVKKPKGYKKLRILNNSDSTDMEADNDENKEIHGNNHNSAGDWAHLMLGTGRSMYYYMSDEDDSDHEPEECNNDCAKDNKDPSVKYAEKFCGEICQMLIKKHRQL